MNRHIIRMILTALLLWTLVLLTACGGGQNGNGAASTGGGANNTNGNNTNVNNSDTSFKAAFGSLKCDDSIPIDTRQKNVQDYLDHELTEDKDYTGNWKDQIRDDGHHRMLTFTVKQKDGYNSAKYLDVEVAGFGMIRANQNEKDNNHPLQKIGGILDRVLSHGCVENVIFLTRPTAVGVTDFGGFVLTACEWPTIPCGDGRCDETCNRKDAATRSSTSSRPSGNSNGNNNSLNANPQRTP
jgi:hypothetical protein